MLPIVCMALIDSKDDQHRFEDIYNALEIKLFSFSMSILHNEALAEDAISETFLRLARNFQKVHNLSLSEIKAYAVIINRNCCYDLLKKEENQSAKDNDELEEVPYNEEAFDIDALLVKDIVRKLPDIYRDTIMLRFYFGLSLAEIADRFNISESAVKKRLNYACDLMRKEMQNNE